MRQGPHQGAQKSTTTGSGDAAIRASKTAALPTSTGASGGASAVWHFPHCTVAFSLSKGMRFV